MDSLLFALTFACGGLGFAQMPRNEGESMNGTFDVRNVSRFPSAYVTVARRWTPPMKRLTNGYEFGGAEPYIWSTAGASVWYRGALRAINGFDLNAAEPGEFGEVTFAPSPVDFRILTVDPKYVVDVLADAAFKSSHLRPGGFRDDALHAKLRRACATIEDATADDIERECLVREVILGIFARIGEAVPSRLCTGNARASVRRAREYLHAYAFTRVMLDDVAGAARVSKYYLERAFRTECGTSIHKYHQLVKVDRGITLIRGGLGLAETAAAVGFADQAHMTRVFRSMLGVTPSIYRPERNYPRSTRPLMRG